MSEVPPVDPGQQNYAPYYRGGTLYGTARQLRLLTEGYFGLTTAFLINIVLYVSINVFIRTGSFEPDTYVLILAVLFLSMATAVVLITIKPNSKIGEALGWQKGMAIMASVLMGLNSALCCGVIGYLVMQSIAIKEIKKYGLKPGGFSGLKKPEVEAKIAELEHAESAAPQQQPPPPGFSV